MAIHFRSTRLALSQAIIPALLTCACGGGGGGSGGGSVSTDPINVLSPPESAVIATPTITVRVQGADWEELWVESSSLESPAPGTQPVRVTAHPFGGDSLAMGIPLWAGSCKLDIAGRRGGGVLVTHTLRVEHPSTTNAEGVRVSVSPTTLHSLATPVQIDASLTGLGTVQEAWLDADGDGRIDAAVPANGPIFWTYSAEGYYVPRVVVRSSNGLYYDSARTSSAVTVAAPPSVVEQVGEFELPLPARDLAADRLNRQVLVLSIDSRLHVFNESGELIATYALQQVQDLVGIDVDQAGDVYAVDRGLHQLRKFSRANAYAPDPTFGANGVAGGLGSESGQFDQPTDIQCLWTAGGLQLWVTDSGNHRVQRFDGAGHWQLDLPTGVDISMPLSSVADFAGHVTVVDGADGDVAVFEVGSSRLAYHPAGVGVEPNTLLHAIADINFGVLITDTQHHALLRLNRDGELLERTAITTGDPVAAAYTGANVALVAVAGAGRLQRLQVTEPLGQSPAEVAARFFLAVKQGEDETARALVAPETATLLTAVLADAAKGPAYRELAGRLGAVSELSHSDRLAAVHAEINPGTAQAQPVVIDLRRDLVTQRWILIGL